MMRSAPAVATSTYAIIGNGIAGITAAEILREEDAQADITVIADDPYPAYYRPALKDYLAGRVHEDKLWARPTNFYQEHSIRFLHDRVVGIQVAPHVLELQSGQRLSYQKLLLAQGAHASRLSCPGVGLQGVVTLRTVADYQWIENYVSQVERIVVTGSGTLALETIETLRHRGYHVTHLLRKQVLWSEVLDATASDLVLQQEQRDGVEVRQGEEIAEIIGQDGWVRGVVTTRGTQLACELVVIAIGIDPIIDFVQRSGIRCGRGIIVDAAMRVSAPDIYAAGDVLETTDPLTGRARLVGQWYPAIQQARAAAYSMLGLLDATRPFLTSTFYNASFLYGLDFASVGMTTLHRDSRGYQEMIADPQPRCYQKVILRGGVPVGMLALGQRKGVLACKRAIDHRVNLSPVLDRLFVPGFQLDAWLDAQGVPAPILSVSRERVAATSSVASGGAQKPVLRTFQHARLLSSEGQVLLTMKQEQTVVIGREASVALRLNHPSVSRQHARISTTGERSLLEDLGSTNGTLLNGVRLVKGTARVLQTNDLLQFGDVKCTFQIYQDGEADEMARQPLRQAVPQPFAENVVAGSPLICRTCGARSEKHTAAFCRVCGASFNPVAKQVIHE